MGKKTGKKNRQETWVPLSRKEKARELLYHFGGQVQLVYEQLVLGNNWDNQPRFWRQSHPRLFSKEDSEKAWAIWCTMSRAMGQLQDMVIALPEEGKKEKA